MENMDYKQVIIQWKEFSQPLVFPRQAIVNIDLDLVTTITGPRRAGKTYFCFQLIQKILQQGISANNVLYINFEDNRLLGATAQDLDKLYETFLEISEVQQKQAIYLFFDEIQVVQNWDAWVRKMYDQHRNIRLIITGSSSTLLSREISTKLRGRVLNWEIFPLRFKELVQWNKLPYNVKTLTQSKDRIAIKKLFNQYAIRGGYPLLYAQKQVPAETLLQNYYESMIFKDVVERHRIEDVKKLKSLAQLLFQSVSKELSYTQLSNKLSSMGFAISKNTVIEYIHHFEDAYLFFQNLKYEYSLAKQMGSIKKIYCIDNGLLNAVSFKFSEDLGRALENVVFIELRQRQQNIYYHRLKHECDFIIVHQNKVVSAIQVAATLDDQNMSRELKGLLEAMVVHKLKEGIIITNDQEEERNVEGKLIKIIPIWKWLLT